jgi:uncharacterized protein (DUF433 family)
MAAPVTSRVDPTVLKAVEVRAARTRRSRSDTIAELIRLGLDVLRFPGITFVDGPAGIRAHVAGTGLDVWEIVMVHRAHKGEEKAVLQHLPQLSRRQLRTALSYSREHKQEIDTILAEQAKAPEEWSHEVALPRPARA